MFTIPEWAKLETAEVNYDPDLLVHYRFDGRDGSYRMADEIAEDLIVQPIAFRDNYSERFGLEPQTWFDLAMVDESDRVAILSVKKASANKLKSFFQLLAQVGIAPQAIKVVLLTTEVRIKRETAPNTNQYVDDSYFAVLADEDYSFVEPERFQLVEAIAQKFQFPRIGGLGYA